MNIYHDSHSEKYRHPFGAMTTKGKVHLAINAPFAESVTLHLTTHFGALREPDTEEWEEEMHVGEFASEGLFEIDLTMPDVGCLLYYYFVIHYKDNTLCYGNNAGKLGGIGQRWDLDPAPYQITVYEPITVPEWYKDGIAYQIFPDRFARGNDWDLRVKNSKRSENHRGPGRILCEDWKTPPFYLKDADGNVVEWPFWGGTLKGIEEKLNYLKDLGVSVIYLNPIFKAASNHRYDTADYMEIDPMLGDIGSFKSLCTAAEKKGIRIILDGVFNHTGSDSKYFDIYGNYGNGAFFHSDSPYRSWFRFGNEYPAGYDCWWGVKDLPNVEETNESYKDFICGGHGVIEYWLKNGAHGFRLDVADELPDSFICEIRKAIKANDPDAVLMGEVWEDASNKISYDEHRMYLMGRELDCTMHYPLRTGILDFILGKINAEEFSSQLWSLYENYPKEALYSCLNILGTHDRPRIMTLLGEAPEMPESERMNFKLNEWYRAIAFKRLKLAVAIQFVMPGVPCIYYGDEVGMEGLSDPYNRGPFPWGYEDPEVLTYYSNMTKTYRQHPALKDGSFKVSSPAETTLAITRENHEETVVLLVNRGLTEYITVVPELVPGLKETLTLGPLTSQLKIYRR